MCLDIVKWARKRKLEKRPKNEVTRYKVVKLIQGKIYPRFVRTPYNKGWNTAVRARSPNVAYISKDDYIPGFHVFKTKKDAESYRTGILSAVIKVKCKGLIARGTTIVGLQLESEVYQFMKIEDYEEIAKTSVEGE